LSRNWGYDKAEFCLGAAVVQSMLKSKKLKTSLFSGLVLGTFLLTTAVAAQEHQHEQHGSHSHGQALLTFVLEGNEAELAFATATSNVIGFEHQAKDDAERQQVQQMIEAFTKASWFSFNAQASCAVSGTDVSSDLTAERPTKPQHADLNANYTLVCQNPAALRTLTLDLSGIAAGVEQVSVQWIVNGEQGAADWTADSGPVSLTPQ
jgi:hypothetical protein